MLKFCEPFFRLHNDNENVVIGARGPKYGLHYSFLISSHYPTLDMGYSHKIPANQLGKTKCMPYEGVEYRRATVGDCVTPLLTILGLLSPCSWVVILAIHLW